MSTNRLLTLASLALASAMSFAVQPPRPRALTTCNGAAGAIYGLMQVSTSSDAFPGDNDNDNMVVIGKASSIPTATLTTGANDCGANSTSSSGTTDTRYSTTANYYKGNMAMLLSSNNYKDARIPQSIFLPSSAENPGTKYHFVQQITHAGQTTIPCVLSSGEQFFKVCACKTTDCT